MTHDLGYRPRRLPDGTFIVLGPDGLTWETSPTTELEAGRIAYSLNGGNEIVDDAATVLARQLLEIIAKLCGPFDVRIPRGFGIQGKPGSGSKLMRLQLFDQDAM